jgi:cytochrome c peroxidase
MGKFKVPTLRDVAVTPSFMRSGAHATLHEVVDFYMSMERVSHHRRSLRVSTLTSWVTWERRRTTWTPS